MRERRALWFVLLAAAVLPYFLNLGATSIIDSNEAFYTETPREMIEAGDYLNSSFNYQPRFNKPPLSYWVVAGFYQLFGISLFAARLPIALGAVGMIATAYGLARLAFSPRAGWVAALLLAATPRFLLFARRIIIDVYSSMFLGLTLLFFALAESDPPRRRRWLLAMYVACGLGVLTKGPIAVVIPALVFPVYLAAAGRLGTIRRLMLPTGAFVVAAIVLPYYVALYFEHGWDYIATFFLRENLARYTEGVGAPDRGPLFYLPVVFTDLFFPWSLMLPVAFALVPWRRLVAWPGWRGLWGDAAAPAAAPSDIRLLLGLWIVLIVAFYSASNAQQDLYVLPFIVAGAALVGGLLDGLLGATLTPALARWTRGALTATLAVLVALGAAGLWLLGGGDGPIQIAGVVPVGILLVAGALAALAWVWRGSATASVATAAAAMTAVLWVLVLVALPDFERYKPVPRIARVVESLPTPAARVGMYMVPAPSFVFYLRRHVDQMFDEDQLAAFFARGAGAYCLMHDDDYGRVRDRLGVALRVVADEPRLAGRLTDFLGRQPLRRMLLVTADPAPGS